MNVDQNQCDKKQKSLCAQCHSFYGSQAYQGLCSSCFKKCKTEKKEEIVPKSPIETLTPNSTTELSLLTSMEELILEPVFKDQKDRKRCFDCNKKIGLLGTECKCSYVFCNTHRLPQNHKCSFDYKIVGKQKLEKQITKVYNGKIAQI